MRAVVGWATEPAYVGYPNAVQIRLSNGNTPIADPGADELKVEVLFGDQKTAALPLEPGVQQSRRVPGAPDAHPPRATTASTSSAR